jgi:hypothetical protein
MSSPEPLDSSQLAAICDALLSKIEGIDFMAPTLAQYFPAEELEILLVGIGMAEAYLAGALTVNSKGIETLNKSDDLALAWLNQSGGQ